MKTISIQNEMLNQFSGATMAFAPAGYGPSRFPGEQGRTRQWLPFPAPVEKVAPLLARPALATRKSLWLPLANEHASEKVLLSVLAMAAAVGIGFGFGSMWGFITSAETIQARALPLHQPAQ